jgi:hypothetical protein
MRTLVSAFACLFLPLVGAAQVSDLHTDPRGGTLNDRFALGYFMAPRANATVQGSVFLMPAWAPGQLLLNGNSKPIEAPLKYDVHNQEVRAQRPNGDSVAVPVARVKEFTMASRRFVCYPAPTLPAEAGGGCAEVLADGTHAQLLKFVRKAIVKQAAQGGGYASSSSIDVLEAQTTYYLRWADGRFVPLRLKRASLEQALSGQPAALAALKSRKGNLGSEADMAAAVGAIDPLLTAPTR